LSGRLARSTPIWQRFGTSPADDARAAELVFERVERALAQILEYPGLGTPALRRGERRFPVRKTGHVIHYKVMRRAIRIQIWYRARQHMKLGL